MDECKPLVGGLKSRNEDLTTDVASLTKRLASELRRAEEAEVRPAGCYSPSRSMSLPFNSINEG